MSDSAAEHWAKLWDHETHKTEHALKRLKSAKNANLTPLKIDKGKNTGIFQGSEKQYETQLDFCPCVDFARNRVPCKHIYRLAIELGVMDLRVNTDKNAIRQPYTAPTGNSLSAAVDTIEKLSEKAQIKLCDITLHMTSQSPYKLAFEDDTLAEIIDAGLLIKGENKEKPIHFGKINEIRALLKELNIPYKGKRKKVEFEELCIKHIPKESAERFGVEVYVTVPKQFSPSRIHWYLTRKLYTIKFLEENRKMDLYPQSLPNDEVTEELIRRGYYSRGRFEPYTIKGQSF